MTTILISNDDGIHAPGLLALRKALEPLGTVLVLAPERNWSASGHNKTMFEPLRVTKVRMADGSEGYASSGGPADCVALAAMGVLDTAIDLVVSGINPGHNLGQDVVYSGTVACAMEAMIQGLPGIAVSTGYPGLTTNDPAEAFKTAGRVAQMVARTVLETGIPEKTILNVNVPSLPWDALRGIEVTRLGVRIYDEKLTRREDPHGRPYYWIAGNAPIDTADDGTDVGAVMNGFASVTPVWLDMTAHAALGTIRGWSLEARLREGADGLPTG